MSLDWNITQCGHVAALVADTPGGWPVTECVIWLTMIVGIGEITAESAEKVHARIYAWETVAGPLSTSGRAITPDDIRRRVGLRTNASPRSDALFRKKVREKLESDAARKWQRDDT